MTILYADDDQLLHRVVKHRLVADGHTVVSAYNGAEALEMARKDPPELMILDGMMPEMDGFTLLGELQQDERLAKIPVIMLTARNREDDLVNALENGAADYLTKPFSPVELSARVRRLSK